MKIRRFAALLSVLIFAASLFAGTAAAVAPEETLVLSEAVQGEAEEEEAGALARSVAGGSGRSQHTPVTIESDGYLNGGSQVVLKKAMTNNDFTGQAKSVAQVQAELDKLLASCGPSSKTRDWSGTNPLKLQLQELNQDGSLSQASKQQLVDVINFQRFCSGSAPVVLDTGTSSFKEQAAQAGADYLSDNNVIGSGVSPHYAADGSGNNLAIAGLRTSNLAAAYRQSTPQFDYNILLENLFHDDDTTVNFKAMGHRRWLLNNALGSIGIGYTGPTATNQYTHLVTYIDGKFGGDGSIEAYPANGAYPVEMMNFKGWSVSLGRCEPFDFSKMTMKVTAHFPGQSEPVEAYLQRVKDPTAAFKGSEKNWFGLASGNCGSGQTILFEPSFIFENSDYTKTDSLIGTTIEIEIDGVYWDYGSWGTNARTNYPVAPIRYKTEFFSATGRTNSSSSMGSDAPTEVPSTPPNSIQNPVKPELVLSPPNPKTGDTVTVYCTNYSELGVNPYAGGSQAKQLVWQYEDANGNPLALPTKALDTASFELTPQLADKRLRVFVASMIGGTQADPLFGEASVAYLTLTAGKIDAKSYSAPVIETAKAEVSVGSEVTFTARPAAGDTWNNSSVTVKWKVNGQDASSNISEDKKTSTCTVQAEHAGVLTVEAAVCFDSKLASPSGRLSVDVTAAEAPKLTAVYPEAADGQVQLTVQGGQQNVQHQWTVGSTVQSEHSSSLNVAMPAAPVTVTCVQQDADGQIISETGRITVVPYDPAKDNVVLSSGTQDPADQALEAGSALTLTVERHEAQPAERQAAARSGDADVSWTVMQDGNKLESGWSASGSTLTIPALSGSDYTVTAQFGGENPTNMKAWDFTPKLQNAPDISVNGDAGADEVWAAEGDALWLTVPANSVPQGATVAWVVNGKELPEMESSAIYIAKEAGETTIEATLKLNGQSISKTAVRKLVTEEMAPEDTEFVSQAGSATETPSQPTTAPTADPTAEPTGNSTVQPDPSGTSDPAPSASAAATESPEDNDPSAAPSDSGTNDPEPDTSAAVTEHPSGQPDETQPDASATVDPEEPSPGTTPDDEKPLEEPTGGPSADPSDEPDASPSASPSASAASSGAPSSRPSASGSAAPGQSARPSQRPGSSQPGYYPTYNPGVSVPAASSAPSASATAAASTAPGDPAPSAPQPVEIVKSPGETDPMLVGITTELPADMRKAGTLSNWLTVPEGGSCGVLTADGTYLPDDALMATGQKAVVWDSRGNVLSRVTLVIKGDVIGNGQMNIAQLVRLAQALTATARLSGPYHTAGDLNNNGRLEIADLVHVAGLLIRR